MYFFKSKEFPDETKSVEFVFDSGIAINRLRTYSQSSNKAYLLYENYGNPNYIDNYEENPLSNYTDLHQLCFQAKNNNQASNNMQSKLLDKLVKRDSFSNFISDCSNFITNSFYSLFSNLFSSDNYYIETLAKHNLNKNRLLLLKVSQLAKYSLFLYDNGDFVFFNLNTKSYINLKQSEISPTETLNKNVVCFDFHPVYDNQFLICKKNVMGIIQYNQNSNSLHYKNETLGEFNDIVMAKFFQNGEKILLLHENGRKFSILKENFEVLMSKNIFLENCIDLVISPSQMFFILFSRKKLYLINLLNLNFEVWTDFSGNINSVVVNENGKYILVTTDYNECPLYVIYHSSLNFFNKSNYCVNDYDIDQKYMHLDYHFFHKIYNLTFSKGFLIEKIEINIEQNRLLVLYRNKDDDNFITKVMLFQIDFNKDINNFSIEFLLPFNELNKMNITHFQSTFNLQREIETFFIVWDHNKFGNFFIYPVKSY